MDKPCTKPQDTRTYLLRVGSRTKLQVIWLLFTIARRRPFQALYKFLATLLQPLQEQWHHQPSAASYAAVRYAPREYAACSASPASLKVGFSAVRHVLDWRYQSC